MSIFFHNLSKCLVLSVLRIQICFLYQLCVLILISLTAKLFSTGLSNLFPSKSYIYKIKIDVSYSYFVTFILMLYFDTNSKELFFLTLHKISASTFWIKTSQMINPVNVGVFSFAVLSSLVWTLKCYIEIRTLVKRTLPFQIHILLTIQLAFHIIFTYMVLCVM